MKGSPQKLMRARRREPALLEKGCTGGSINRMSMRNDTSRPTPVCQCRMALVSKTRKSMQNGTMYATTGMSMQHGTRFEDSNKNPQERPAALNRRSVLMRNAQPCKRFQ